MKKFILTLLVAFCIVTGLDARTFVLSAGISNYGGRANDLSQTSKDAKRFSEMMKSQTKDITLLTSKNVTKANLMEKLRAICNRAQKGDRIVFFFSGHGSRGALAAYDGLIPYEELVEILSSSKASEKICFIDACFAGTAQNSYGTADWNNEVKNKKDIIFFVASRPEEISLENTVLGAGHFTQALLKGLHGKADRDTNKKITIIELFKYIYGDVIQHTNDTQHPQLIGPKSLYDKVIYVWK